MAYSAALEATDDTIEAEQFRSFQALPSGSPGRERLREQLVEHHVALARRLASRYRDRGEPLEDLEQVALVGLVGAVDRFEPERGVAFAAFAIPTILGELRRHFRDHAWSVRVSRRYKDLRAPVEAAQQELGHRLGRPPTGAELAEHTGLSEDDVQGCAMAAQVYRSRSLDALVGDGESPLTELVGGDDAALELVEYREALKPLLADLPPRERQILLLRFFGNMTQSQIGAALGISQMHVSRLLTRTLAHLRESLLSEKGGSRATLAAGGVMAQTG